MGWLINRHHKSRIHIALPMALVVLAGCSSPSTEPNQPTEVVTTETTEAEPNQTGLNPGSNTTTSTTHSQTTNTAAKEQTSDTTTSNATTTTVPAAAASPDLDEELAEFEDLEALLDELDDLLADL